MNASEARSQRGFTVPEMLVAMMLLVSLAVAALSALQFFTHSVEARTFGIGGAATIEREISTMRDDANTSFAVFVPQNDVFGFPNVVAAVAANPPAPAHEVDYYGKTDTGAETWWAYYFDRTHRTLQRYDYDPTTGVRGVFDRNTGAIDARGRYPQVTGVSAFSATSMQADALVDSHANKYAPLMKTMMGSGTTPRSAPVGFVPSNDVPRADLYGGNTSIEIAIASDHGDRTVHLMSGALPSGFTIHEALAFRPFVYRINTLHRSWLGFAQKTKAQIFEQIQYSYHPRTDPPTAWKVWCDFQLYGFGAGGETLNDPLVTYHPYTDFSETAASMFYQITHNGVQNLDPKGCDPQIPSRDASPAPRYTGPSPDTYDTAPPCFSRGTCFPENAPPDWTPPSPWPSASPRAQWCAGHMLSPLCGGPGGPPTISNSPNPTPVYDTPAPAATADQPQTPSEQPRGHTTSQ